MLTRKYAAGTAIFSKCPDRFVPVGYHKSLDIKDILTNEMMVVDQIHDDELNYLCHEKHHDIFG